MSKWYDPYSVIGQWYRGNTHLHTFHGPEDSIRTDPITIINWYRSQGYHFLNFSDHNLITQAENPYDDFVVFSGHESDCIVGIDVINRKDINDAPYGEHLEKLQFWADDISNNGGIVQLAHPKPTLMGQWEDYISYLENLNAVTLIELYNNRTGDYSGGAMNWQNPIKYAVEIWDHLLLLGIVIWPTAVDDSHDYLFRPRKNEENSGLRAWEKIKEDEDRFFESGGGWMCVLAEQLTPRNLKSSIRRGSVYASQGPIFKTIGIRNGKLIIEADEACVIKLVLDGESLSEHRTSTLVMDLPSCQNHQYLRVELIDEIGKRALSSPFIVYS